MGERAHRHSSAEGSLFLFYFIFNKYSTHVLACHPPHGRNPRANPTAPSSPRSLAGSPRPSPRPPAPAPPAPSPAGLPRPATPARSRLRPRGSPPGPRACPSGPKGPRDAAPGRAGRARHGGRLTVRLGSRARLRHGQEAASGKRGWAGKRSPGLPWAQLAEEASTEPRPPPPREEPLRLEPPAPPQPRAETDRSADLRLFILTAGNKQCAGAGGWGGT